VTYTATYRSYMAHVYYSYMAALCENDIINTLVCASLSNDRYISTSVCAVSPTGLRARLEPGGGGGALPLARLPPR
jgi:hypothetical protein